MAALFCLPEVASTNSYCAGHLRELFHGDAVFASRQTAGRGRGGRTWAEGAGGLYLTVVLKEKLCMPSALPLYIALAVSEAAQHLAGVCLRVKWPNDLLYEGKKLCGILCESHPEGFLCGVGLNVNQKVDFFVKADLPYGTSLRAQTGKTVDLFRAAEEVQACILKQFQQFARQGFPCGFSTGVVSSVFRSSSFR